jgi:hypothetical protein
VVMDTWHVMARLLMYAGACDGFSIGMEVGGHVILYVDGTLICMGCLE